MVWALHRVTFPLVSPFPHSCHLQSLPCLCRHRGLRLLTLRVMGQEGTLETVWLWQLTLAYLTYKTRPPQTAFYFTDIRKRERKLLEKAGYVQSGNSALASIVSTIAIVLTFTCHILLRRKLTAPVVRTSLDLAAFVPCPWQDPGGKPLPHFVRPWHQSTQSQ